MLQPPVAMLCDVKRVYLFVHAFACLINSTILNRMTFLDNRLFIQRAKNCEGESYFLAESSLQS